MKKSAADLDWGGSVRRPFVQGMEQVITQTSLTGFQSVSKNKYHSFLLLGWCTIRPYLVITWKRNSVFPWPKTIDQKKRPIFLFSKYLSAKIIYFDSSGIPKHHTAKERPHPLLALPSAPRQYWSHSVRTTSRSARRLRNTPHTGCVCQPLLVRMGVKTGASKWRI